MAAVVDRPLSALSDSTSQHRQQRSTPVEVIDVDLLEDTGDVQVIGQSSRTSSRSAPPRRQLRLPTETISLVDSDDELEIVGSFRPVPRRRVFSPPPPRQNMSFAAIPPVPPLPARFAGQGSFPPHPRNSIATAAAPPVIRPVDREFSFEHQLRPHTPVAGPSNPGPSNPQPNGRHSPPLRGAARSQHVPVLGLGGALISNNRARLAQERRARAHHEGANAAFRRIRAGGWELLEAFGPLAFDDYSDDDDLFDGPGDHHLIYNARARPALEKEDYKPEYTHPAPAEAGFTFDFAPPSPTADKPAFPPSSLSDPIVIDDDEESTSGAAKDEGKLNALLVCARCLEPLVLNSGLTAPDTTLRRVWALRCGHLVDGKCLAEIGQPPQMTMDRKGKGKAQPQDVMYAPYGEAPQAPPVHDQTDHLYPSSPESNTIRSRLRSQQHHPASDPISASSSSSAQAAPQLSPVFRKRKRLATKPSPKKKPRVEEEYSWACPVASCGRLHVSVKVNGGWGPEKERQVKRGVGFSVLSDIEKGPRGAIPIFA